MKKELFIPILSLIFLCSAMIAAIFLPPRIGWHSDGINIERKTDVRYATLASYLFTARPQTDNRNPNIGTEPYDNFYVRTYALELWVVGGVLLLTQLSVVPRMRKAANQKHPV